MGSLESNGRGGGPSSRKPYEKPAVTRIVLDARCAVLGFCKTTSSQGPGGTGCEDVFSDPCSAGGS